MSDRRVLMVALVAILLLGAFGLGASGVPGHALWAAIDWAVDQGYVELNGPVGAAVAGALG